MSLSRSIFPTPYLATLPPVKYDQQIVVNWLDVEIEDHAERWLPMLETLSGHRNREVHSYVTVSYGDFMERWLEDHPV